MYGVLMTVPAAGETIATVTSYPDLVEAFRAIKGHLGLSNEFVDETCEFSRGFTDKVLGPTQNKTISALTFSMFCQVFAVKFHMEIDLTAVRKMEAVWEGREERNVRALDSRISKKLIDRAQPHVLRNLSAKGNEARKVMLTGKHRSDIARKAAKARWKGHKPKRGKRKCVADRAAPRKLSRCDTTGHLPNSLPPAASK